MAGSGSGELRAPIFDGTEFEFWKVQMVTIFKSYGIWKLVDKGISIPESKKKKEKLKTDGESAGTDVDEEIDAYLEEQMMKDAKALGIIQGAVSKEIFSRIVNQDTAKGAWDLLQEEYHGDEQARSVKLQSLRREFEYMRMRENESLAEYFSRFFDLTNQMEKYGEILGHQRMVQKVLISLTKVYDSICVVLERTSDLNTVSVHEIVGSLKSYELRVNRHEEEVEHSEKAFASMSVTPKTQNNQTRNCGYDGGKRNQKNWKNKPKKWENKPQTNMKQGNGNDVGKPKCKVCDKTHYARRWIWIGTAMGAADLLICIVCYLLGRRRNFPLSGQNGTKIQELLKLMKYNRPVDVDGFRNDGKMGINHRLSIFTYASIVTATCNFSNGNKIGEGAGLWNCL